MESGAALHNEILNQKLKKKIKSYKLQNYREEKL